MKDHIQAPHANKNPKDILIRILKGFLIGIGAILPGLSGGVLMIIFGIYDPLIRFLSNLRKKFIQNLMYFFPIGIGGLLGILIFSIFVEKAFGKYAAQFVCLFIGFVVGTFPSLYKEAGKEGRSWGDFFLMLASAILLFVIMYLGRNFPQIKPSPIVWLFSGGLVALGFIVPGMSPSNFLIYFGLYDKMASSIHQLDFSMLIPFGIGAVLCILLLAKVAEWLFKKFYSKIYHFILGMVIGSSLAIFPSTVFPAFRSESLQAMGLSFPLAFLFAGIMFVLGIFISYRFSKLEESVESQREKL